MFLSGLITFRESLEAALVVGIILSFLTKTYQNTFKKYVWIGVGGGVVVSITLAFLLRLLFKGLEGKTEQMFEGVLMIVTAGFLTWMILWVHRQKGIAKRLERGAKNYIEHGFPLGLSFLVFTSVLREGVETVFYLQAVSSLGVTNQFVGSVIGIASAIFFGFLLFKFSLRVKLQKLLKVSGTILLLFAAGLVSHAVHEFQEVGLLPLFHFDPLINISHILDETSILGSILRTLFGYTAKPTFLELLSYGGYVFVIFVFELWTDRMLLSSQRVNK